MKTLDITDSIPGDTFNPEASMLRRVTPLTKRGNFYETQKTTYDSPWLPEKLYQGCRKNSPSQRGS